MSRFHSLKCWPRYYQAIVDGRKRFELRRDDRGFDVGDVLELVEWDPRDPASRVPAQIKHETGRSSRWLVTYILRGPEWGLPADLVIMSIAPFAPVEDVPALDRLREALKPAKRSGAA